MSDYYDTLGTILRDKLGTGEDPFAHTGERRQKNYRPEAHKKERRTPFRQEVDPNTEPIRVPTPAALAEDFAVLHVLPGMPLDDCKRAWKQLLKKYHPDFIPDTEEQQKAASVVRRINRSYKRIETWFSTGKVQDYDTL